MLIDCISDLHGFQPELAGGDILIIAGDLTAKDTKDEYTRFILWLSKLPYRCKIVIAGNHDGLIEKGKVTIGTDPLQNIWYLCDSFVEFEGLKIWGSPWTPTFLNWYFMKDRGDPIKEKWKLIPSNVDILVTHGPPYGIFDETMDEIRAGCEDLRVAVQERVKPRIHCFGHIHECGGSVTEIEGVTYVNCSYVDERYRPVNSPIRLVL
jgi:Icc-related predicted phosphoesterase